VLGKKSASIFNVAKIGSRVIPKWLGQGYGSIIQVGCYACGQSEAYKRGWWYGPFGVNRYILFTVQSTFMWPWQGPSLFLNITTSQFLLSWNALDPFSLPHGCDWSHYWQPDYITEPHSDLNHSSINSDPISSTLEVKAACSFEATYSNTRCPNPVVYNLNHGKRLGT
jgi:hypothetical protein